MPTDITDPLTLPRPPARRSEVPAFIVMDVISAAARREAAGERVIHMEVGQPGTPAPAVARAAVKRLIDSETLGYTEGLGVPLLRARIARHYLDCYGITVAPERVIVTTGSSAAFVLAFLALFDPIAGDGGRAGTGAETGTGTGGDRVLLPSPGYPCYRHILSALGIGSRLVETPAESRWMPTAEQIAAAALADPSVAGLLLASPANPTGTMLAPDRLAAIVATCRERRLWFISDEIYHGLAYAMPARSALEFSSDVIVINSFSKYFSMTGWRIGWMVVPPGLVRTVERLAQNLYISPPAISQAAALAAFDAGPELEANRDVYAANRDLLLSELPRLGLDRIAPADGAFYLYADVSRLTDDSLAFTRRMLAETGVAATPGIDFDEAHGRHFVRFSYSGGTTEMAEAVERLRRWPALARGG